MKYYVLALCFLGPILANSSSRPNFNVVVTNVTFTNVPTKYKMLQWNSFESIIGTIKDLKQPRAGTTAVINDYADKLFANLQKLIIQSGLDPVELPDQHSGFNYTLIFTYHGELDLTKGWIYDLSSIHRGDDVEVSYSSNTKYLEVTIPIAFDSLQFSYDYSAKLMGLGPSGGLHGKISNVQVRVKIGFDVTTLQGSLDEFYITNSGHIDVSFNGNPLVDWLVNLLTDVVSTLLKPVILLVVEGIVRGGLDEAISAINEVVDNLINPTTALPSTTVAVY